MAEDLAEYTAFLVDEVGQCDCFPCTAKPEVHHPKHLPTFAPWMRPAKALGGKPGKGQRCSDWYGLLLCPHHHADLHRGKGFFKDWGKAELRAWQEKKAAAHQNRWGMRHPERLPGTGAAPRKTRKTRTAGKGWTVAGVLSLLRREANHRPGEVSAAFSELAAAAEIAQTEDQQWERSVQQLTESLLTMPAAQRARVLAGLPEFTTDSERALLDRCAELQAERDEARDWVRKLTSTERTLTCVYCGHAYPPGSPDHGAEVLTAHIAQCVRHPMQAVIEARNRAEARVLELEEALGRADAELEQSR